MTSEEYKELRKERWFKNNCGKSQLLCNNIIGMNPEVGFYIKVENLEISEDFFKEEYDKIKEAYFSVLKKLDEYYKKTK